MYSATLADLDPPKRIVDCYVGKVAAFRRLLAAQLHASKVLR